VQGDEGEHHVQREPGGEAREPEREAIRERPAPRVQEERARSRGGGEEDERDRLHPPGDADPAQEEGVDRGDRERAREGRGLHRL
jgi:hypothetical protein